MFINALENFIEQLKSSKDQNEWYLADFIQKNIDVLTTSDAYEFSSLVIKIIKNDSNSDLMYELISILKALQIQSDTTQIPLILISFPEILNEVVKNTTETYIHDLVNELNQCYRIY